MDTCKKSLHSQDIRGSVNKQFKEAGMGIDKLIAKSLDFPTWNDVKQCARLTIKDFFSGRIFNMTIFASNKNINRRKIYYPHNPERRKTDDGRRVLICSKCGNEIPSSRELGEHWTHAKNNELWIVLCVVCSIELEKGDQVPSKNKKCALSKIPEFEMPKFEMPKNPEWPPP